MGDDILKQIARDLTVAIKNSVTVDWAIRESVQAKMKMTVKRLLKKYGYPPDQTAKALEIVMDQTKLMCENIWRWGKTMNDNMLNSLWEKSDALRGNVDVFDYKHIVLGLIF